MQRTLGRVLVPRRFHAGPEAIGLRRLAGGVGFREVLGLVRPAGINGRVKARRRPGEDEELRDHPKFRS